MKRLALIVALGCAGIACREAPAAQAAPAAKVELATLTLEQVEAKLGAPNVFLFDANPKEFYEHGHLPGAAWVKFDGVTAGVLPADRAATLIFYCANELCTASHTAAEQARALGYANTFLMPQGFIGWKKSGRVVVRPDAG
ncbi:MAG: rhodanese-like domain-containing protein [Myxococcota bacterium]